MKELFFDYNGKTYPDLIRNGFHTQYITPIAKQFCQGKGIDIGANRKEWSLPGVDDMVDLLLESPWNDAYNIPVSSDHYDYVFSSHCLEHLADYYSALEEWTRILKPGGVLFLYLPHKDMEYWRPANNRKHVRICEAEDLKYDFEKLGFRNVIHSGRDLAWSFCIIGEKI